MIQFSCPKCGKNYKVDDQLAGKRAKCKGCGEVLAVPTATAASAAVSASAGARPATVAATTAPTPAAPVDMKPPPTKPPVPAVMLDAKKRPICPGCGATMGKGAVLCIACGFDIRIGRRIAGVE